MKRVLITILGAAALVGCSKNNGALKDGPSGGTKTVVVNMSTLTQAASRAAAIGESESLTGQYASVDDCIVYFLNANGEVVKKVNDGEVSDENAVYSFDVANNFDNDQDHQGSEVFTVETSAEKVYVLCNATDANLTDISNCTSLAEIEAKTYALSSQHTNIVSPLLDGEASITAKDASDDGVLDDKAYEYVAEVTVTPKVMRLEIHEIKAAQIGENVQAGDIVSFKVAGIYAEGYHPTSSVGGELRGTAYAIGNSVDLDDYAGYWITPATATSTNQSVVPENGKVWGYTLFPEPVQVIVKLTDIERYTSYTDASNNSTEKLADPKYITVTGFKTAASGSGDVAFAGGSVYKVASIAFNGEDLTDTPNQTEKSVKVTVTVAPWNEQTIYPDMAD
ncbi:MAG: hypothetical protein LIO68_08175 [Rikenellaceae bacterium]|nr:hypothetical protein [Rikenellaceae bacterium]MCC8063197.1 hypothetical protein [Rikenellaceae bacterium]